MRVHKVIFRVDYPTSFSLADRLGGLLDGLAKKTVGEPFSKVQNTFDFAEHQISNSGYIGENSYNLSLGFTNFNGEMQFPGGKELSTIARSELFSLADELFLASEMNAKGIFNRIGVRFFVLIEDPKIKFDSVISLCGEQNKIFFADFSKSFPSLLDIAQVLELKTDTDEKLRVTCGPYKISERGKYFRVDVKVPEGFLVDIDFWQTKVSIPGFKVSEFAKTAQNHVRNVCANIKDRLMKELPNAKS